MQGGSDPELPGTAYFDLVAAVKQRVPGTHVHAFSPMEVVNGASRTGLSIEEFLIKAREAGPDTIPGTGGGDPGRRRPLDPDQGQVAHPHLDRRGHHRSQRWAEVVLDNDVRPRGQPSPLGGAPAVLRRIQAETGGFTEFVPLPFVHTSSPIYLAGVARPGPSMRDNRAVHAMARIMLHGAVEAGGIPHVQTSWVKLGVDGTRVMLQSGADDLGGTLMEETISRMAGSQHGSAKTVAELVEIGAGIGRPVRERTTTYGAPTRRPHAEVAT